MIIGDGKLTGEIDRYCIDELNIPEIVLMENAVLGAVKHLRGMGDSYLILCGVGNNGGDGLGIARHLIISDGAYVKVALIGNKDAITQSASTNLEILEKMQADIRYINKENIEDEIDDLIFDISESEIIVDCIFGTGLNREIKGFFKDIIYYVNTIALLDDDKRVVAIDIPSGLEASTGEIMGICINADITISFEFYKKGFLNYEAQSNVGEIFVESLGIPKDIAGYFAPDVRLMDKCIDGQVRKREKTSHKGSYGRVVIAAGSYGFAGACEIASKSAIATGSGLVTIITQSRLMDIIQSKSVEAMTAGFDEEDRVKELVGNADAIGFGTGMGKGDTVDNRLKDIVRGSSCPIIIDADGIDAYKRVFLEEREIFKGKTIILTPHPGELSRLIEEPVRDINSSRVDLARAAAQSYGCIIVLKGSNTVIADSQRVRVSVCGCPEMANGGMGDCLTGIITSLCGQGYDAFDAACIGVNLHGLCGEEAARDRYTVTASDIIAEIPHMMKISIENCY